jgi:hypothetical protein
VWATLYITGLCGKAVYGLAPGVIDRRVACLALLLVAPRAQKLGIVDFRGGPYRTYRLSHLPISRNRSSQIGTARVSPVIAGRYDCRDVANADAVWIAGRSRCVVNMVRRLRSVIIWETDTLIPPGAFLSI